MSEEYTVSKANRTKNLPPKISIPVIILLAAVGILLFFIFRGTPATSITFYENAVEVIVGNDLKLDYAVLPSGATNKTVRWESSNPSVAEVDKTGVVTAICEGDAIIMASTSNGKIDECLVTVKPTAFDYLKKLCSASGEYAVFIDTRMIISIISQGNFIFIKNSYDDGNVTTSNSVIHIPSSLSGNYAGGGERTYFGHRVHTTYSIDASKLTSSTNITSNSCDSENSWDASYADDVYTVAVRTALFHVYQQLLEPNGYTYADLGFHSYS